MRAYPKVSAAPNRSIFCLLLALGACRTPEASQAKDIATNSGADGTVSGVYLYFREDQSISRTACPDGILAVNYNRDHCTDNKQSVPAKPFIDAISVGVGTTIDGHAKNVQDLFAGIATVDNKLLQLLAAAPATAAQVTALQQQLTNAETQVAGLEVQLTSFDQQIAAIKAQLATQSNIDLNIQLGSLLDERATVLTQENQAKVDEQTKREAFITANSSTLDQDTYVGVAAQRATYQQQLDGEKAALTSAMQEVSDLNKTLAHISDPTFTFDVLEGQPAFTGLKPFTRRFQATFTTLLVAPTAVAPAFSPTSFPLAAPLTATFAQPLPSWVTSISVTIDGKPSTIAPAAQFTLPLFPAPAGKHTISLTLVNAQGQTSQASPVQSITILQPQPPAFWPLNFPINTQPLVSFTGALPSWAVNVYVQVDGQASTLAATPQFALPLSTGVLGTHSVILALVDASGQMSQSSSPQTVSITPPLPPLDLLSAGAYNCIDNSQNLPASTSCSVSVTVDTQTEFKFHLGCLDYPPCDYWCTNTGSCSPDGGFNTSCYNLTYGHGGQFSIPDLVLTCNKGG